MLISLEPSSSELQEINHVSFPFCSVVEAREVAGKEDGSASTELPGQLSSAERSSRTRV